MRCLDGAVATSIVVATVLARIAPAHGFLLGCDPNARFSLSRARTRSTTMARRSQSSEETEIPSMDWLTDSLKDSSDPAKDASKTLLSSGSSSSKDRDSRFIQEVKKDKRTGEDLPLESPIPQTGISVMDEMEAQNRERFFTSVVPIERLPPGVKAAKITTKSSSESFEPVRYIIGLNKADTTLSKSNSKTKSKDNSNPYVMVDVPPFSEHLAQKLHKYMASNGGGHLMALLITSKDAIHYDEAPAVYTMRRADLAKWKAVFPSLLTVSYRLDTPRDCRKYISQILDGYSPHALEDTSTGAKFVQTGRPLVYKEWDHDITQDIMTRGKAPPDQQAILAQDENAHLYTPEAIREREEGKRVLSVYTPGRTHGSVSYIFPQLGLCCSGYTIPVEDSRDESMGLDIPGPMLDYRGYVTTSKAGITKQMRSARELINTYGDRFSIVLGSSGDPLYLDENVMRRKKDLLELVDQYEQIGSIYEQLGITNTEDE